MPSDHRSHSPRSRSPVASRTPGNRRVQHRHHRHRSPKHSTNVAALPFNARQLSKHDMKDYLPILASYLDIQKQIQIEDLDDKKVKGRWKSFVGKWNRGELAEGWYDPSTKSKTDQAALAQAEEWGQSSPALLHAQIGTPKAVEEAGDEGERKDEQDQEEEADFGPVPAPSGPSAPNFEELAVRDEVTTKDAQQEREALRVARKADRTEQRERLDEIVPRAEAGTKERALEKKREAGATAKAYRESGPKAGEMDEVDEGQLLGGEADIKSIRQKEERKKNEREIKREEILRARAMEREERMRGLRDKESKAMESLKAIAKERFG